jgi:hypothetical protein
VGGGSSGRFFQRFWNNIVDWLIAEPETRRLQLESDKDRYRKGQQVLLKVSLVQKNYQPSVGTAVKLILKTINNQGDNKTVYDLKTDKHGEGTFMFLPDEEGFYSAHTQTNLGDETLEEEIMFSVLKDNAEFEKPLVNETLLKKISEISGGRHHILNGSDDLSVLQFSNPSIEVSSHSRSFSLWNNWWAYGLVMGFLVMDWYLRRKSGLS